MARHKDLDAAVGIDDYFANPHNLGNDRLMSISTGNFDAMSARALISRFLQEDLDVISHHLNTMTRRIFQWASAEDRYNAAVVAATA